MRQASKVVACENSLAHCLFGYASVFRSVKVDYHVFEGYDKVARRSEGK